MDKNNEVHISFNTIGTEHNQDQWFYTMKLLGRLKRKKCFKSYWDNSTPTMPDIPNTEYVISEPNIKKLREYKKTLEEALGLNNINTPTKKERTNKPALTIDLNGRGIYMTNNPKKLYPVGARTKRRRMIKFILTGNKFANDILAHCDYKSISMVSKEIKKANELFRIKVNKNADLIS